MTKRINTSWILYQNNKMRVLYSILGMIGLSVLYFYLCKDFIEYNGVLIDWIGGTNDQLYSISKFMIKISYLCLIFLYIGKLIEDITTSFTCYLAPRYGNRKKLITEFSYAIILHGILLVFIFQIIFAIVGILYLRQGSWLLSNFKVYCYYIFIECISTTGVIIINMIVNIFLQVDHSSLYIMALYIIQSVIPKKLPIATTLCKLGEIYVGGNMIYFGIQVLVTTVLLYIIFRYILINSKY